MEESLISWNLANFITIVLMVAIIWVILGSVSHVMFRAPAQQKVTASTVQG